MVYSKNIEQVQFIAVLGLDFAQFCGQGGYNCDSGEPVFQEISSEFDRILV